MMLLHLIRRREALGSEWRLATRKRRGPLSSPEIAIEQRLWVRGEQARLKRQAEREAGARKRGEPYEETVNWLPVAFTVEGRPRSSPRRATSPSGTYQFQSWAVSMVDALPFGGKKKGADGGIA